MTAEMSEPPFVPMSPVSDPHPDKYRSEMIVYGSAWKELRTMLYFWDYMESVAQDKVESLKGQITNPDWVYNVMKRNPSLIFSQTPMTEDVSKLRDLVTLRNLVTATEALMRISEYRRGNIFWARLVGMNDYYASCKGRSVSDAEWRNCIAPYTTDPCDFKAVNGIVEDEYIDQSPDCSNVPPIDPEIAMRCIFGDESYDDLCDSLRTQIYGEQGDDCGDPARSGHRSEVEPEAPPYGTDVSDEWMCGPEIVRTEVMDDLLALMEVE